jgi:hypothetical protein
MTTFALRTSSAASAAIRTGSRGAVLRSREPTRFSPASDDEVGAVLARSALAMFAPPICRRSRRNASRTEPTFRAECFVGSMKTAASRRTSGRAERARRHSELGERGKSNPDRAPLSWTNERADTLFVCERVRKAAACHARSARSERSNLKGRFAVAPRLNHPGRDRALAWKPELAGLQLGAELVTGVPVGVGDLLDINADSGSLGPTKESQHE